MKIAFFYSHSAQKGVYYSLQKLGHDVQPFFYGFKKHNYLKRFVLKLSKDKYAHYINNFNKQIFKLYKESSLTVFDLVLFMKGHYISDISADILSKIKTKKILWTTDSLSRFPGQASLIPYVDKVYFQDGADAKSIENSQWLPLGFDNQLFKYSSNKDIDVLMLGTVSLPNYELRRNYFYEVSSLAKKNLKVVFAGRGADDQLLNKFKRDGVINLGQLPFNKYAETISRAKICINIHQSDGGMAINPLFFAIPATGAIQIHEPLDYLSHWLNYPEIVHATSIDDINELVLQILDNYNKFNIDLFAKEIENLHSFDARASLLLNDSKMLNGLISE